MDSEIPPIPGAVLPINFDAYTTVQQAMPLYKPHFTKVLETTSLFSRTRHPYIHGDSKREAAGIAELLDTTTDHFNMEDTMTWFLSPVHWRDVAARSVATRFLKDHQIRLRVNLKTALRDEKLLQVLEQANSAMRARRRVFDTRKTMMALETLHKSVILYMWMSQRMPIVFPDLEEALEVKEGAEKAMEYVLRLMTKGTKAKDIVNTLADGPS
jgi:ATP-dependent RNA helicase SUPV3L1/SUV3